jgi:hypothetical protein
MTRGSGLVRILRQRSGSVVTWRQAQMVLLSAWEARLSRLRSSGSCCRILFEYKMTS